MKVEDKSLKVKSLWCDEAYDASLMECCAFCRGTDVWHGIELSVGNMVSGYPFEVEGVRFHNSEGAYIAAAFSLGTDEHLLRLKDGARLPSGVRPMHAGLVSGRRWECSVVRM